jgi:hypothetical protein
MNLRRVGGGIAVFVVAVGVALGSKMMGKDRAAKDVKGRLMTICAENQDCTKAVTLHFDSCFDKHYSMGGRYKAGSLKTQAFTQCMNEKAGENYFAHEEK